MKRRLAAMVVLVSLVTLVAPARAAFENLMTSPRARAMGDASVAVDDATFAATLNPAQLARLATDGEVGVSYVQPYSLDFHRLYYLGAALRLPGEAGSLGLGFRQYGVEYQNVDLQTESTLTVAYGLPLYADVHSRINLGVGLNLYRLEFGETVSGLDPGSDLTTGLDVGFAATLHDRTHMGVLVHNVNAPKIGRDEEELPRRLQAGLAYEPYAGVLTVFELENVHGEDPQWHAGMEFDVLEGLVLRAGLITRPNKLTAGFGYRFGEAALSYGFSTGGGVLESTHQFGLSWAWGGE
ncbi:MAG: hypothetical protein R3D98_07600 [Candidatus Krumholzibacteriia bacterium]